MGPYHQGREHQLLIERLADGARADVAEHELISVWRANHAGGPADVLDNHLLLQGDAQSRLQNTSTDT